MSNILYCTDDGANYPQICYDVTVLGASIFSMPPALSENVILEVVAAAAFYVLII